MRILLTGVSGFVGAAAKASWSAAGHEVWGISRAPNDGASERTVTWDLGEPRPRDAILPERIEAIVHMAQARRHRDFPAAAPEMFAINTAAAQSLLQLGAKLGVKRFCLISSGNVYEPYERMDEGAPVRPARYLGASKLAAEVLAAAYADQFEVSVMRLFQPYGPGQGERLIPQLIQRVAQDIPLIVSQDGEGLRVCPTYVDDVNAVILDALTNGWAGVFNVAAPEALSIRQIGEKIGNLLGKRPTFQVGEAPSLHIVPALDRLSAVTDLSRFRSFDAGLRSTLCKA